LRIESCPASAVKLERRAERPRLAVRTRITHGAGAAGFNTRLGCPPCRMRFAAEQPTDVARAGSLPPSSAAAVPRRTAAPGRERASRYEGWPARAARRRATAAAGTAGFPADRSVTATAVVVISDPLRSAPAARRTTAPGCGRGLCK
jgi:hypothetical protein